MSSIVANCISSSLALVYTSRPTPSYVASLVLDQLLRRPPRDPFAKDRAPFRRRQPTAGRAGRDLGGRPVDQLDRPGRTGVRRPADDRRARRGRRSRRRRGSDVVDRDGREREELRGGGYGRGEEVGANGGELGFGDQEVVVQMVEQLVFLRPGERVSACLGPHRGDARTDHQVDLGQRKDLTPPRPMRVLRHAIVAHLCRDDETSQEQPVVGALDALGHFGVREPVPEPFEVDERHEQGRRSGAGALDRGPDEGR